MIQSGVKIITSAGDKVFVKFPNNFNNTPAVTVSLSSYINQDCNTDDGYLAANFHVHASAEDISTDGFTLILEINGYDSGVGIVSNGPPGDFWTTDPFSHVSWIAYDEVTIAP